MPGLTSVAPRNSAARHHRTARAAKPWLAALLPLLLAFGLMLLLTAGPVGAQATDYDMDDDGLIEISNAAQLSAMRHDSNGNGDSMHADYAAAFTNRATGAGNWMGCPSGTCSGYELSGNITLTGNWTPIGSNADRWGTTFDGRGNTISGLTISGGAGMFHRLGSAAVIRDVGLISPSVSSSTGRTWLGALAGQTDAGSVIHTSYVSGGTVTLGAHSMRVGGLVGHLSGTLRASWSTATIDDTDPCTNCNSTEVGGLVGRQARGAIVASYAAGAVRVSGGTNAYYGGAVGYVAGTAPGTIASITNTYCDSSVMVVNDPDCVGRHQPGLSTSITGTPYTTTQLQTPTGYTGIYSAWNIDIDAAGATLDYPWNFGANNEYPTLNTPAQRTAAAAAAALTGNDYDTDNDDLIEIDSYAKLNAIRYDLDGDGLRGTVSSSDWNNYIANGVFPNASATQCPNGCEGYELTANLTMGAPTWTPTGTWNATFDGQGYTLTGATFSVTGSSDAGLFGNLGASAVIRDLGLVNFAISATATSAQSNGILAGFVASGATISSVYASGGSIETSVQGSNAGGLVGYLRGTITASYSTATVRIVSGAAATTIYLGGLAGRRNNGVITASYARGTITDTTANADTNVGGLVGRSEGTSGGINNSYCISTGPANCVGTVVASSAAVTTGRYTAAQLQTPTDYAGIYLNWNADLDGDDDLDYPWNFGANSAYPLLNSPTQRAALVPTATDYDADDDGLIDISTQAQLNALRWDLNGDGDPETANANAYGTVFAGRTPTATATEGRMGCPLTTPTMGCVGYELTGDLALTGNWTPLGIYNTTLDGNGYAISGLTISTSSADAGFSRELGASAVIRNLGFSSPSVTSTATAAHSHGVLAGYGAAGAVVSAVYSSGGTITTAANSSNAGGLVGLFLGTIRASWSSTNVAVSGNPTGLDLGGLVAHLQGGTITASYARGTVTGGSGASVNDGLLVGRSGNNGNTTPTITNSYCVAASGDCIGASDSGSGAVAATRQTVSEMQTPTDYSGIFLNWNIDLETDGDLDYPWNFGANSDYPTLNTPTERAALIPAATDYDSDDDGLIDISTQAQLNAMRWDLNGDGAPETANSNAYGTAFGGRTHTATATTGVMGCPRPADGGCTGYELTGDLALTGNWTPIGPSASVTYNTTFDGNGHTISGLTVSVSADAGLFGRVGGSGVVRNVGLISPSVTSSQAGTGAAGLVGYLTTGGVIETSYVDGGTVTLGNGLISAGGLVGYVHGAVRASWSTATLQRTSPCNNCNSVNVGGLAGRLIEGSITASYAAGPNNASGGAGAILGGLVGRVTGNSPTITHSYCDSTVMVVTNCIGGYAVPAAAANASAAAQSTSELQTPTDYTGIYSHWNLDLASPTDNVPDYLWNFGANNAYPMLNTPTQRAALLAAIAPVDYDYNDNGLIDITNQAQLNAIRWDLNGDGDPATADAMAYSTVFAGRTHTADSMTGRMGCPVAGGCTGYELLADLTLTGQWAPIGISGTAQFATTFNGQGYTISGLTISVSSGPAGLFGQVGATGVIRNLGIINPSITNAGGSENNGALASHLQAGSMVDASYASGGTITVSGANARAGGLVGQNNGHIRASYSTAAVTHSGNPDGLRLGGLVGFSLGGQITASYAAGAVTPGTGTSIHAGGLVGRSEGASDAITNSYCDSTVMMAPVTGCVGANTGSPVSTATAAAHSASDLQSPTGYTAGSIYEMWNLDLDGDTNTDDNPWDFGTASDYPTLRIPAGRPTLAARTTALQPPPDPPPGGNGNGGNGGGSRPQPIARGGGQPYHPASAHPEIYTNPRHEMAVSCALRTTGTGDDAITTSTMTFDLGTYTRPITLVLSLWDGQFFRTLQSQNIPMPTLRQDGQTATVEVVTDPSQTRFRIDSEYGLNLVLGYADCRTDDPE